MTLDKSRIRNAFNRAAPDYAAAAVLARETDTRLLERSEFLKLAPQRILDLGAGAGQSGAGLRRRFPHAHLLSLDLAEGLLRANPWKPAPWWRFAAPDVRQSVCGDAEQLPLATESIDLVWSNLMLPWGDPARVIRECHRVLVPQGLFLFSTLGPDTLKELRAAFTRVADGHDHVQAFADMHDLGDDLVQAGFADPVMERENLKVLYPDLGLLVRDLRVTGGSNSLPERGRGMMGRKRWAVLAADYESRREAGGLPATFEIVFGHAWKPGWRKTADGRPIIEVRPA